MMPSRDSQIDAALAKAGSKYADKKELRFEQLKAEAKKKRLADEAARVAASKDDTWATTVVGDTGKTQAQIDALTNATNTTKVITENLPKFTSTVNPVGIVETKDPEGKPIGEVRTATEEVKKPDISAETKDAFAMLKNLFATYGLEDLAGEIEGYMTSGLTANEALIKLKTNPKGSYAARFAGNFARVKAGFNAISEAEYIDLESSYAQTLRSYGLGNMLSIDRKANWNMFAKYIENDISAVEFKERIDTVQKRVVNADPATKDLFKKWYPSITDTDLVSYFLDPTRTIDKLKAKTTAAEIGSAFVGQGLLTDQASAEGYATYGIDRAGALQGAANIAEILPETTKLGDIYGETGIKYSQKTAEEEFLKADANAARKRNILASKERASFSGSAGFGKGSASTGYLNNSSLSGQR